jgi:predicted nucleic acid-binding Zn ribbon protein
MVNQCIGCGKELPEGNHVCKECMDKASNYQPDEPRGCMSVVLFIIALSLIGMFLGTVIGIVLMALSMPLIF